MTIIAITPEFSVSDQINTSDIDDIKQQGFKTIICNRPDEEQGAIPQKDIALAADKADLGFYYVPIATTGITSSDVTAMRTILGEAPRPILAYCRSGSRSASLFHQASASEAEKPVVANKAQPAASIVIVGGGAGGISVASSMLKRNSSVQITIVDPADVHCYQPGWTLVAAGVFNTGQTIRTMASQIPGGVKWIKKAAVVFRPEQNQVDLDDGSSLSYDQLVVCPGLKLDWSAVDGLEATLGQNGVTSNYRAELAPYTWDLVRKLKSGNALFTQPPMPIKCAGAPQKAMYLSSDYWLRMGVLSNINVEFCNAIGVLFGVKDYVPALMEYVAKYQIDLSFNTNLTAIDGANRTAIFTASHADGE